MKPTKRIETIDELVTFLKTRKKKVLFLENDNVLRDSCENFREFCTLNNITTDALFRIEKLPLDYILERVQYSDVLVFCTTWMTKMSHQLEEKISEMKHRGLTVIECYVNEPSWYRKPDVEHEVITLCSYADDPADWDIDHLEEMKED